jgi:hypothetical protein
MQHDALGAGKPPALHNPNPDSSAAAAAAAAALIVSLQFVEA